ncbi:MAG: exosortase system-associated protein, TIGR04073 family [Mariprofundaceae bacterium]
MKIRYLLAIATLVLAIPALALAGNAGDKLAEGVGETATGWTEAPKEMAAESEHTNPVVGVTKGAVVGTGKAVGKTLEGAGKTATFFVPDED